MKAIAEQLRSLINEHEWTGTITELVTMLNLPRSDAPSSEEHLAIWLRRHEPALWWHHGIFVRFSRTGKRRLVHLARRGLTADVHDGNNVSLAVTPSE